MNTHLVTAAAAAALALLVPTVARAQLQGEKSYLQQSVPAPASAFEVTVASGYTQGFGHLQSGVGMPSVAKAGLGFEASAGYRIDPNWGISLGGQYQELVADEAKAARGFTPTLAVQYHIDPQMRADPWVELGTGYRMLWQVQPFDDSPTMLSHGFQLVRGRVGFDVRVSPDLAFAPVIGADLTMFLYQNAAGNSSAIADPTVSTFVFAGVQGRIDIGGKKVGTATVTSAQPE